MKLPKRVIVVGDAHVDDRQSLKRFAWLGNMIDERQPDYVITIGDFMSLNCLSAWDRSKRAVMENLRYTKEIAAGNKALDMMTAHTYDKKVDHRPHFVYVEGNHEDRLTRYLDIDPTFEGQVGIVKDLRLAERDFTWVPYKQNFDIMGTSFTHIPINGIGKAIGNPNVAAKALKLYHNSVVFGHTHTLDTAGEHRQNAPHLNQALAVGCFFEHIEEYAKGSLTNHWRGVVELELYKNNRFDFSTTSMRQMKNKYSS